MRWTSPPAITPFNSNSPAYARGAVLQSKRTPQSKVSLSRRDREGEAYALARVAEEDEALKITKWKAIPLHVRSRKVLAVAPIGTALHVTCCPLISDPCAIHTQSTFLIFLLQLYVNLS
jgi:hypothetical protein